jgi:hypothetical protein
MIIVVFHIRNDDDQSSQNNKNIHPHIPRFPPRVPQQTDSP